NSPQPPGQVVPPPPSEPLKNTPPPPPPKEEPPAAPPPPPEDLRPEVPQDPEEAARLQQLQAAAAQWQQVQQQRAGLQYQALMQQHEKLQHILEQYQQLIQQPADLQSRSAEMQLQHYEMQQQQFTPLFQDWNRSFALWYEQFQTYPHKDQLQDYEHQWKQWQEQMNATNTHLQERVATLTAMVPFAASQYNSGIMGPYGQYPGQDMQMQQQSLNPSMQFDPPRPRFGPPRCRPPFDGPPRFDQPRPPFDGPPRFDQARPRFDGPPRFDQPQFGQQPRFDQPPKHPGPPPCFELPPGPQQKQHQGPQPKTEPATKQPPSVDSKTLGKSGEQSQSEKEKKSESGSEDKPNDEDMTNDNLLGNESFFVQNDPIPQTLSTTTNPEESSDINTSQSSEPKPVNDKPSVTDPPPVVSKGTPAQNPLRQDGPLTDNNPKVVPKPLEIHQKPQASSHVQSRPEPPGPPPGRGRGQPPVPAQELGRGRGQRGRGDFRGLNTVPLGEERGDMSYDYMPPEEDSGMTEEQEEYQWQDPSYEDFGGMSAVAHTSKTDPVSWDTKPAATDYQPVLPAAPTAPLIPKTVDYGHGHEPGTTVERISYGERIVLRPDPVPSDRVYEKEPLGLRDPYSRDLYYERRPDPYMDRREYNRERDLYREKLPPEYERERFERERYPPREIDNRRSYPEDRGPPTAPPLPPPPQPPPRVEKKPEIKNIDDILKSPGRLSRPERIVIIMRGLPGSGKSHVAKLIRDKEVDCGGAPPRVLVLDDYFMTEVEKVEKDPDTGKRVKTKVLEYEYEPEMEDTYRSSMLKTFRKTLDDGFFPFIILDTINDKVKQFDKFWSAAKTKGFEVYLAEITADTHTCAKRNIHGRTLKDIMKMSNNWEASPRHMVRLDVRSLLQDAAIEEVSASRLWFSIYDYKLDGLVSGGKRKREGEHMAGLEDYLQLPDDYATRMSEPGKKRVIEQKDADRKRAIGFVVGQTDWEKITDESGQLAQRALNRTKYF
uniref:YLP motif-containing protein 1 n=1 Tax=Monopterus albus TaxID=43700 RepID=A0A3Q3Q402_MONAL